MIRSTNSINARTWRIILSLINNINRSAKKMVSKVVLQIADFIYLKDAPQAALQDRISRIIHNEFALGLNHARIWP
jgi:DNA polymerase IIIc chi subunit